MDPRASIDDVAREAGVSVATVSRALRDLPNVAPATRDRVRLTAQRLDYEPHPQAASLASGKTMAVGLVAPLFGLWYAGQIIASAESVLSAERYDLLVHAVDTPENQDRFLQRSAQLRGRVDGLLLVDFFATPDQVTRIRAIHAPAVTVGEHLDGFGSVTIDNRAAATVAVTHLIQLGHTRIGLLAGPDKAPGSPVPRERRRGFVAALERAGLEPDPSLEADGGFDVAGGANAIEHLLGLPNPPTALFSMSDEMAMGAMGRARDLGYEVPGDVSIIGFDDHELAEAFGLTTMHQPVRHMGRIAAAALLARMGEVEAELPSHVVDVVLINRSSTAPLG